MREAELVFTGGPVITMDPDRPEADALAVASGRVVAVGREEAEPLRTSATDVVDLDGRALLPGFVEAHGHPAGMATSLAPPAVDVRPFTAPDGREVWRRIEEAAARRPGRPLFAQGIDPLLQPGLEPPTRELLDRVCADAPVVVVSNSGHVGYGNSAALAAAGIGPGTPDPEGARFVRDAAGHPTGEAQSPPAVHVLGATALAERLTPEPFLDALAWAYHEHARAGVTTVAELACDPRVVPALSLAAEDPHVAVRTRAYVIATESLAETDAPRPVPPEALFGVNGVKLWADGSPWQGTAATSFPYVDGDRAARLGLGCAHEGMNHPPERLSRLVTAFTERGWQVACHVHGDLTAEAVVAALEHAGNRVPERLRASRPRLEHCGAVSDAQLRRAARLGATVSLFPDHLRYWGDVLADDLFGKEVAARWSPARSALDAGHRISLHNDGTVTPTDPLSSVASAVTRRAERSGRVHGADQRIGVEQALCAVTAWPAWQLHLEDAVGVLRRGMRADLAVLRRDPRRLAPDRIPDEARVSATYLGGRATFSE